MTTSSLLDSVAEQTSAVARIARDARIAPAVHFDASDAATRAWNVARAKGSTHEDAATIARTTYADHVARASMRSGDLAADVARVDHDAATARAAGFALKSSVFTQGVRAVSADRAGASRVEFERMPLVTDACSTLVTRIADEDRQLVKVGHSAVGMDETGALMAGGALLAKPSREAFFQLVTRLGYGGGAYLEKCPSELRAANVNAQRYYIEQAEKGAPEKDCKVLVARTRTRPELTGARETFAVVSDGYAVFDSDEVARAIRTATPKNARGGVTYDGTRARFTVLFETTVEPAGFVAGEFFRAGVQVTTGDTGGNSVVVRAVVWQHLCANMMVIDQRCVPVASIRHVGTAMELARKLSGAFSRALDALAPFLAAWGYARTDNVVDERVHGTTDAPLPSKPADAMRWIFAGLLSRDELPLKGRVPTEVLDDLIRAWERDESSATSSILTSRAAVANAITRVAHESATEDPWLEDEWQQAAGRLMWGRKGRAPAPLQPVDLETLETPTKAAKA